MSNKLLQQNIVNNPLMQQQLLQQYNQALQMQNEINRLKMEQQAKILEKRKILEKLNPDEIKNALFPQQVINKKDDIDKIVLYKEKLIPIKDAEKIIETEYLPERDEMWKGRTNDPYKVIIKNDDFKKNIQNPEDMIVYTVSEEDKNEEKLDKELHKFEGVINEHNNELKSVYSKSKELKNIKSF